MNEDMDLDYAAEGVSFYVTRALMGFSPQPRYHWSAVIVKGDHTCEFDAWGKRAIAISRHNAGIYVGRHEGLDEACKFMASLDGQPGRAGALGGGLLAAVTRPDKFARLIGSGLTAPVFGLDQVD